MNLSILIIVLINIAIQCFSQRILGVKRIGEPCKHDSECYKGLRCQKVCQYPVLNSRNQRHKLSKYEKNDKCPPGWFDYSNTCYYISRYRRTWVTARQDCQMKGAELLVIDSDIVLDFSIDFFTKLRLSNSYFVGARANGLPSNWEWLNGKKIPTSGFMWSECGSPSNSGGTNLILVEGCATLNFYGLNDITCDSQHYFICSKFKSSRQNQVKIKIFDQKLLQGTLRGLKKCRYDYNCIKGLICTQNGTCGCPHGFFLPPNFDKCVNKNESDFMTYIASYDHLDFFVSNSELTWRSALENAIKYDCSFLMLENSLQLAKFIDLAIKNNLIGTYWIGVFSLNRTATWIDCSPIPNGPWFPSFNGCSSQIIEPGLVCFALENFKIVIKNCADRYYALYVKGCIFNVCVSLPKLTTSTSTTIFSTATTSTTYTSTATTSSSIVSSTSASSTVTTSSTLIPSTSASSTVTTSSNPSSSTAFLISDITQLSTFVETTATTTLP